MSRLSGTSNLCAHSMVLVVWTPWSFPCASLPHSLLRLCVHRDFFDPWSAVHIVSCFPLNLQTWCACWVKMCWAVRAWAARWRKLVFWRICSKPSLVIHQRLFGDGVFGGGGLLILIVGNSGACVLMDRNEVNMAHQDLTGHFPMWSSGDNEYILMGYHCDSNRVLGYPVKNHKGLTLTATWQCLHNKFAKGGTAPEVWVMDNEILADLKSAFQTNETKFQLVPPKSHRRNLAERAIQTLKKIISRQA